ncbi:hypothetical protein AYI69_g1851 [Smittium culicis]|uniref:Uncharacterized protein n=1 Tax=Smittium culicis TaxID=133412 RepID=A0A1R1YPA5_9FUNG|nr:hypothetical protein AYI69_g1851 [Smittium culicis]
MISNKTPISIIVINSILSGCIISKNFNLAYLALDKINELNLKKSIQTRILALKIFELSKNIPSFFDQVKDISDSIDTDLPINHSQKLNIPSKFTKDEVTITAQTKRWRHHEFFSVISGFFNLKLYPYVVLYGSLMPYHSINFSKSTSVLIINSLICILENNKTSSANNDKNSLTIPGDSRYMNIHNLLSSYPNLLSSLSESNPFSSVNALPESSSINPSFKMASVNIQNVFYDAFNRSKNYITIYKKLPLPIWLKFFTTIKNSFGLEFAVFISNILLELEPLSKHKSTVLAKIIENLVADYSLENLNCIQRPSKLKSLSLKSELDTTLDSASIADISLKPSTKSSINNDLFFVINSLVIKLGDLLLDFPQTSKAPKIKSFTENSKLPKFDSSIPAVKLSSAYWTKLIWVYKENNQLPKAIHIFRLISLSKIFDLSSIPYASLFINLELNSEAVNEAPNSDSNFKLHHSDISQYIAIQEIILVALSVSFNKKNRIDHKNNSLKYARNIFDYDVTTHITNYFLQNQTQDSLNFLFKMLELISLSSNLKIKSFFYGFSQKNSILDTTLFLKAIEISAINGYWDVWERLYSLSIELEKSIRLGPSLTQILVKCQGWDSKFIVMLEHFFQLIKNQKFGHSESLVSIKKCCVIALKFSYRLDESLPLVYNIVDLYKKSGFEIPTVVYEFLIRSLCFEQKNPEYNFKEKDEYEHSKMRGKMVSDLFLHFENNGFKYKSFHYEILFDYFLQRRRFKDLEIVENLFDKLSRQKLLSEKILLSSLAYFLFYQQDLYISKSVYSYLAFVNSFENHSVDYKYKNIMIYNKLFKVILSSVAITKDNSSYSTYINLHNNPNISGNLTLDVLNIVLIAINRVSFNKSFNNYTISVLLSSIPKLGFSLNDSENATQPHSSANNNSISKDFILDLTSKLISELSKDEFEFNVVIATSLIRACDNLGLSGLAIDFFNQLDLTISHSIDVHVNFEFLKLENNILNATEPQTLCNQALIPSEITHMLDKISKMLNSIQPNLHTFNALIQIYLNHKMPQKASKVLYDLVKVYDLSPNIKSFAPFINYFENNFISEPEIRYNCMEWAVECMKFFDIPLDSKIIEQTKTLRN